MELSSSSPPEAAGPSSSASEQGVKLFVGGISSDLGEETLREHFAKFGPVHATVMRDRVTGRGRGFAFVQFADPEAAESALKNPKPVIYGRTVEVKRAIPRCEINQNEDHSSHQIRGSYRNSNDYINSGSIGNNTNSKKIFIGGLPDSVTQLELKSFFEKFGSVIDTVVMYDNMTQRPRGFGFITFASEDSLAMALKNSFYELNGKIVQVKRAVPKDDINCTNNRNNDNHYSQRATTDRDKREPVYGLYQHMFYPRYMNYGYFNYYASPYLYGGGYTSNGLHGVGYGDIFGNSRSPSNGASGLVAPDTYHPYANGGYGTTMLVPTVCYTGDNGLHNTSKNQGILDVQSLTVPTMSKLHIEELEE
ncbi:hypothetical protein Cni_G08303 [Canna indica]|uniref:RRM domain-containing protein n=1 Tax=Canna indica TaxID=4628 RepID=A0AAQ3K0N8_9LILI|nr:hypothetical protein Cni_G08303 [Canna indica]